MSSDAPVATESPGRPRGLLWVYAAGFALLAVAGAFCVFVVRPQREVNRELARWIRTGRHTGQTPEETAQPVIARLGGPPAAARKIGLYLRLPERFAPEKSAAIHVLGCCGADAVPRMIALLGSSDEVVSSGAARFLGRRREPRGFQPLVAALSAPAEQTRSAVAEALGALRDPRAAGPLAAALHDPEATVRAKAAEALGRIGDRSAIEALTAALNDPSRAVQAQAAGALLELGAPLGFEGLLAALENEDIEIRLRAVLGLRALGDERAIAPLEQCAKNNRYLEVFVNDAIERIRDAQPRTPARAP